MTGYSDFFVTTRLRPQPLNVFCPPTPDKPKNATTTGQFGFVSEENSSKESI